MKYYNRPKIKIRICLVYRICVLNLVILQKENKEENKILIVLNLSQTHTYVYMNYLL